MGRGDFIARGGEFHEHAREAYIEALEGDVIDHQEQIGDAARKGSEDEIAKRFGAGYKIIKHGARDSSSAHSAFADALSGIVIIGKQAGGGEHAALPGFNAVEHDLVSRFGDLLHAQGAIEQEQHVFRGIAGAEEGGARRNIDDFGARAQQVFGRGIKAGEAVEPLDPGVLEVHGRDDPERVFDLKCAVGAANSSAWLIFPALPATVREHLEGTAVQ